MLLYSNKDVSLHRPPAHPTMKRLLAACCLFWTLLAVAGPQPYFRHLGSRDGLAHPSVMSIAQDSLGRMWFGTENGISRYDVMRNALAEEGGFIDSALAEGSGNRLSIIRFSDHRNHDIKPSGTLIGSEILNRDVNDAD